MAGKSRDAATKESGVRRMDDQDRRYAHNFGRNAATLGARPCTRLMARSAGRPASARPALRPELAAFGALGARDVAPVAARLPGASRWRAPAPFVFLQRVRISCDVDAAPLRLLAVARYQHARLASLNWSRGAGARSDGDAGRQLADLLWLGPRCSVVAPPAWRCAGAVPASPGPAPPPHRCRRRCGREHLRAAIAQLPAMGGAVVDALDALRDLELLAVEEDDLSESHCDLHARERRPPVTRPERHTLTASVPGRTVDPSAPPVAGRSTQERRRCFLPRQCRFAQAAPGRPDHVPGYPRPSPAGPAAGRCPRQHGRAGAPARRRARRCWHG